MTEQKVSSVGYTGTNKYIIEFIREIHAETGIHPHAVWAAIYHFLSWQWISFHKAEFFEYVWDRCFVFKFFNRTKGLSRFNRLELENEILIKSHYKGKNMKSRISLVNENNILNSNNLRHVIDSISVENAELFRDFIIKTYKRKKPKGTYTKYSKSTLLVKTNNTTKVIWNINFFNLLSEEGIITFIEILEKFKSSTYEHITKPVQNENSIRVIAKKKPKSRDISKEHVQSG